MMYGYSGSKEVITMVEEMYATPAIDKLRQLRSAFAAPCYINTNAVKIVYYIDGGPGTLLWDLMQYLLPSPWFTV